MHRRCPIGRCRIFLSDPEQQRKGHSKCLRLPGRIWNGEVLGGPAEVICRCNWTRCVNVARAQGSQGRFGPNRFPFQVCPTPEGLSLVFTVWGCCSLACAVPHRSVPFQRWASAATLLSCDDGVLLGHTLPARGATERSWVCLSELWAICPLVPGSPLPEKAKKETWPTTALSAGLVPSHLFSFLAGG